jgi:hypothetical protein
MEEECPEPQQARTPPSPGVTGAEAMILIKAGIFYICLEISCI